MVTNSICESLKTVFVNRLRSLPRSANHAMVLWSGLC